MEKRTDNNKCKCVVKSGMAELTALCVNNSTMSRKPIEKIGRAKHRKHIKKYAKLLAIKIQFFCRTLHVVLVRIGFKGRRVEGR